MAESFAETIIAVIVGAVLGFLASIGYPFVQGWLERRAVRIRLKQELVLIREIIKQNIEKGNFEARGFRRDYYQSHTKELNEILNANTWETITKADTAIHDLGSPENIKERYANALKSLDDAIGRL